MKVVYYGKEWKIAVVDGCLKVWKRTDLGWEPYYRAFPVSNFVPKKNGVPVPIYFLICNDQVTTDDDQTHVFMNAGSLAELQGVTGVPFTQRHIDILNSRILAEELAKNGSK